MQHYDELARVYEDRIAPHYATIAAEVAARVSVNRVQRVLEVAAGTGVLTRLLAPTLGSSVSYIGLDIAVEMMSVARPLVPVPVDFVAADVRALPLPDASVDLVVGSLTPLQDVPEALAEAHRVLVPGGRFVLGFWGGRYRELRLLREVRRDMGLGDYPTGAPAKAVQRITRAGFVDVDRDDVRIPVIHADVETYLDYRAAFGRPPWLPEERQGELREAIRSRLSPYVHRDGSVQLDWTVVVVSARRG